jgi:hypothetical protein
MNRRASFNETNPAPRRDTGTEHDLFALVVNARLETEARFAARLANRPAGKTARDFVHVLLRVAAVDPQSMKLHQLARVVLVEPAPAIIRSHLRRGGVRTGAQPIVQIKKHRGALRRGAQEVAETAQRVRPNRVAVVGGGQPAIRPLGGEDIEVIGPEIDHHFIELTPAVERAQQPCLLQFQNNHARALHLRLAHHRLLLGLLGRRVKFDELATAKPHGLETGESFLNRGVGNALWPKLFIQVGADAQPVNPLHFIMGRSETGPIQKVYNPLFLGQRRAHGFPRSLAFSWNFSRRRWRRAFRSSGEAFFIRSRNFSRKICFSSVESRSFRS